MEASVSNLTSPGDRVLVLTAGKFGERWTGLAKAFGCEPDVVTAPYGETFNLAQIRAALKPEHRAVYMQATETSTAVSHDVEAIAKLIHEVAPEAILVVDGITGLGTTHFDVDAWGIDILIGGSQKAVMATPVRVGRGNAANSSKICAYEVRSAASSSPARSLIASARSESLRLSHQPSGLGQNAAA